MQLSLAEVELESSPPLELVEHHSLQLEHWAHHSQQLEPVEHHILPGVHKLEHLVHHTLIWAEQVELHTLQLEPRMLVLDCKLELERSWC